MVVLSQTLTLALAIPFTLASYLAMWPAVSTGSALGDRLFEKENEARRRLVAGALNELKSLRVRLDELFKEYDDGNDPFLRAARPNDVLEPAREFVRLTQIQVRMSRDLQRAQRLSRISFWFLVAFSVCMTLTVICSALESVLGPVASGIGLLAALIVFACGGTIYVRLLLAMRRLDGAHVEAGRLHHGRDGDADDLSSLSGESQDQ